MTTANDGHHRPDSVRQVVVAQAGIAYGVVGADIHVFGDGRPVYLLFAHRGAVDVDSAWMRAQPSRMLDARAEVVAFTGRDAELGELVAWRDGDPRFAVRWLHGEGGQGKTRLAARLAADSERAGWKVVTAVHGTDAHPPAAGSQDLRVDGHRGVLLLVDYADRWPQSHLTWLFHNMLLRQGIPARVLLIGRSVGGWPALRGKLDQLRENVDTSDQLLAPLPGDGPARDQMFASARDCFARQYPQAPTAVGSPSFLRHPDFGLTLAVHMAALVAVDAVARGRTPPGDMPGLTVYLLDREHENWQQLFENSVAGLEYRTPASVMARAVYTAILTGPTATATASAVLDRLVPDESAGTILADHAVCYPPAAPDTALEPLLPDRLAEDFLALMVPGHTITGFQPDPWATAVPAMLVTSPDSRASAPRAVTFLSAAADRWPHVGERVLYPLLHDRPDIAVDAGSTALTRVAAIGAEGGRLDHDLLAVLEKIETLLPGGRSADLDVGILGVAERLTAHRLATTTDSAQRAWLFGVLGNRRTNAGERQRALEAHAEAVRLNRALAEANPDYRPHLAMSLHSLGGALDQRGRLPEAFDVAREAVRIHRELAETDPGRRPALALSLINLGHRLSGLGRFEEAAAAIGEAVAIYRELAAEDPGAHLADLAHAVTSLGVRLTDARRESEALAAMEEAVQLNRALAEADPDRHLIAFATALANLGRALPVRERGEEAVTATREAVELFRRLADANPAAHKPSLVACLLNLRALLFALGRRGEGLPLAEEAVALSRELVSADPALHWLDLARALVGLGNQQADLGHREESLATFREAADLYGRRREDNPQIRIEKGRVLRHLAAIYHEIGDRENEAHSLLNLSAVHCSMHTFEDGVATARAAAALYRELGDLSSEVAALLNLGFALSQVGRGDESAAAYRRAAAVSREKGDLRAEAAALTSLGDVLRGLKRFDEVIPAAERACALFQEIDEPGGGQAFFQLGSALLAVGRAEESIAVLQRAATAYRDTGRGPYQDSGRPHFEADAQAQLANALHTLKRFAEAAVAGERAATLYQAIGNHSMEREMRLRRAANLLEAGQTDEAIAADERLVALCRQTGDRGREAAAQGNLGAALLAAGRPHETLPPCEQAVILSRELGDPHIEAAAHTNIGKALGELRQQQVAAVAFENAVVKWREAGDRHQELNALYSLGSALTLLSIALRDDQRLDEAIDPIRRAATIFRDIGNRPAEGLALRLLGADLLVAKRLKESIIINEQAARVLLECGDQNGAREALGLRDNALQRLIPRESDN